jgi:hypothetical protein
VRRRLVEIALKHLGAALAKRDGELIILRQLRLYFFLALLKAGKLALNAGDRVLTFEKPHRRLREFVGIGGRSTLARRRKQHAERPKRPPPLQRASPRQSQAADLILSLA